jgi:hypothetical protein
MNDRAKVYVIKRGHEYWTRDGYRGRVVDDGAHWSSELWKARVWQEFGDANDARIVFLKGTDTKVVRLIAVPDVDSHIVVTLPVSHTVLADFLESYGLLEQANAVRGIC